MSYFAETIAWFIVGLVQIGLLVGSGVSLFQWNNLKSQDPENRDAETMNTLLIIGTACGILAILFLICVCCFFQSLKIAIDVIDASADFLAKTKRVILVPVFFFIINVIAILVWLSAFVAVTTLKYDDVQGGTGALTLHQIKVTTTTSDGDKKDKVFMF